MVSTRTRVPYSDKLLAFIFGVIFLSAILVIAIFIPTPSDFSYSVFRIVLALAAAGVGAVIPGFLNVEYRNVIRAGGAIALFVIVYFFPPVPPTSGSADHQRPVAPASAASAKSVAQEWLQRLDRADYSGAYGAMADAARSRFDEEGLVASFARSRSHLGRMESRSFDTSSSMTDPPGSPKGEYQNLGFKTKFSNIPEVLYESVSLYGEQGHWKPVGSYIFRKTETGQMVPYSPPDPAPSGSKGREKARS